MGATEISKGEAVPLRQNSPEQAIPEHARLLEPYLAAANHQLEVKKTPEAVKDKPQKKEWTVAIDLVTNLESKGPFGRIGAEDKMTRLKDLAAITQGTAVAIIAQAIEPKDLGAKPKSGEPIPTGSNKQTFRPEELTLSRYLIKDGSITALPPVRSAGYNTDLTNLLQLAAKEAPANRTALLVSSHGNGNKGLVGDNGAISLSGFEKAVQAGLSGSGHEKLDLLDFDACLMAQNGVVSMSKKIAKHLVASAEVENADAAYGVDGQDLDSWLAELLLNPNMNGAELGKAIIAQADKGANDGISNPREAGYQGTPTLALFNLEAANSFQKSLDGLGKALSKTIENPANLQAIHNVIDSIPLYAAPFVAPPGGDNPEARPQKRDLNILLTRLSTAIDEGKISDKAGSLKEAITGVKTQTSALTEAIHRSNDKMPESFGVFGLTASDTPASTNYQEAGGLSVFLPESTFLKTEEQAKNRQPSSRLLSHCKADDPVFVRKLNADSLQHHVAAIEKLDQDLLHNKATLRTWQETKSKIAKLQGTLSGSDSDFLKASESACQATRKLIAQPSFRWEKEQFMKKLDPTKVYKQEGASGAGGWNQFLQNLKRRSTS